MSTKIFAHGVRITPTEGGKEAIERIIEAYGFGTRTQLAEHMGVTKGGIGNRWMRDTFPFDWVIVCAIETKASLTWLMTGEGPMFEPSQSDVISVNNIKIIEGVIHPAKYTLFDLAFLKVDVKKPLQLIDGNNRYILETSFNDITDGQWLVEMDGTHSLRRLAKIPSKKLMVSGGDISFECSLDDIEPIGRVVMTTSYS